MRKIFAYLSIALILVADVLLLLYGLARIFFVEMGLPYSVFTEFVETAVYLIIFRIAIATPICLVLDYFIKRQDQKPVGRHPAGSYR